MTSKFAARFTLLCMVVPCSAVTQVQDNMQRLGGFKNTGAPSNVETVPQGGARTATLKANLKQIKLSPGFKIDLYAIVSNARHVAVGPNTDVVFVGTRKTRAWAVSDHTKSHVADRVKMFTPSVSFKIPNDLCFSPGGVPYVAEQNHVLAFPAADSLYESPGVATAPVVPQGELTPVEEGSLNHTIRTCRIGPDDKLYITLGNPFDVPFKEKVALYDKAEMMGIIRMDRDDKHREVFACGVHNSVEVDSNPKDKTLWFTDNQVSGMGDDIPPDELNRAAEANENFGFPWYDGEHIRTVERKSGTSPSSVVFPRVEMVAHAADLGMTFYKGKMFPTKYQGSVFSAQHGSWNRIMLVSAYIVHAPVRADGTAGKTGVFVEGWLTSNNEYLGRPIDVATLSDGSLLISDDYAGVAYRVSHVAE